MGWILVLRLSGGLSILLYRSRILAASLSDGFLLYLPIMRLRDLTAFFRSVRGSDSVIVSVSSVPFM